MVQPEHDRRNAPRKRTLKSAKIVDQNSRCVLDCVVRNMSATGAKIALPSSVGIPETFMLLIEADGIQHNCRIIRREPEAVGVQFLGLVEQMHQGDAA